MPRGTEWVGGVCPTTLIGRGNDALTARMGGGITGGCRGASRPRTQECRALGAYTGGRAPGVAGLGAYGPGGTRNGGHTGPGDCRTDRHRVPTDGKRLSGTESTRNG